MVFFNGNVHILTCTGSVGQKRFLTQNTHVLKVAFIHNKNKFGASHGK